MKGVILYVENITRTLQLSLASINATTFAECFIQWWRAVR